MQLFPGNGGDSDLGDILKVAAIGAGAYYGLGALGAAGAAEGAAGIETLATPIGGGVTALASPVTTGGALASPVLTSAIPGSIASLAAPTAVTTMLPSVGAGLATSVLKGIKEGTTAVAPAVATGLAAGLVSPKIPGMPGIPAVPSRADTAIAEARKKAKEEELKRRGRAATILTGSRGIEGGLGTVTRPEARGAVLLGG